MAKKITVRGSYYKNLPGQSGTQLATYETEVVVAAVQPDYIRDAVEAILPAKLGDYAGRQTSYPDYSTAEDTDAALTVDTYKNPNNPTTAYDPGLAMKGADIGPGQSAQGLAQEQGKQQIQEQVKAAEAEQEANPTPATGYVPGEVEGEEVTGDFSAAPTLTPSGTIPAGETEPVGGEDDTPPAPAA